MKKIVKIEKKSKAKKPSKSTYNPLLQVDYPLFLNAQANEGEIIGPYGFHLGPII